MYREPGVEIEIRIQIQNAAERLSSSKTLGTKSLRLCGSLPNSLASCFLLPIEHWSSAPLRHQALNIEH